MPSVKPFDNARPRPRPVVLSVSPSRWKGAKISSLPVGGDARSVVDDADLGDASESAGRDAHPRCRAARDRAAFASTFTTTRCSSTGSARSGGRSGSSASSTDSGPRVKLVDRRQHDVRRIDRRERDGQHAGLHAADVQKVRRRAPRVSQGSRRRSRGVRDGPPSISCDPAVRSPPTAATAAASGPSKVVADRRQESAADLIRLGEYPRFAAVSVRSLCSRAAPSWETITSSRRRSEASSSPPCSSRMPVARLRSDRHAGLAAVGDAARRPLRGPCPRRATSRTPAMPERLACAADERGTALSPRSTLPATVASSSDSASARSRRSRVDGRPGRRCS